MAKLLPPKELLAITPYRGGAATFAGARNTRSKNFVKLSSNEGAYGASAKAVRAFRKASSKKTLGIYPEGSALQLREALAQKHNVAAKQIICGSGSDDLLQLLTRLALYKGGVGLHTTYGFALYPTLIRAHGGTPLTVPEKNFRTDIDGLLKKANSKTKILLLANPNNPTGTYLNFDELQFLRKKLPEHVLLVLDSAYAEYVCANDYEAGIKLVKKNNNVAMTRTFSKIYGLASLRLGWAFLPPALADILNRIRLPFNVPRPTLAAGLAALQDEAFVKRSVAHNEKWRAQMKKALGSLVATDSAANFLLLDFKNKKQATLAFNFLGARGFILREMSEYGLDSFLRLTISTASTNRKVVRLLQQLEF